MPSLSDDLYKFLAQEELKEIARRIRFAVLNEIGNIPAPRHIPGQKNPKDRIGKSEAEELFGPDYTSEQVEDLAIQRAIDRERERGIPEERLENVATAIRQWLEEIDRQVHEEDREPKRAATDDG